MAETFQSKRTSTPSAMPYTRWLPRLTIAAAICTESPRIRRPVTRAWTARVRAQSTMPKAAPAAGDGRGTGEAVFLERLQGPRNVAAEEPGAVRDSRLGRLPGRFRHVPESMEVDEDALGRSELHMVPMRPRLLKRASPDSHAIRGA